MYFSVKELELNKIIEKVISYTKSDSAKDYFFKHQPTSDILEIKHQLTLVNDLLTHNLRVSKIPLYEDFDIFDCLKLLKAGYILAIKDIMQIRLLLLMEKEVLNNLYNAKKLNVHYDVLHEITNSIINHNFILNKIDTIFDERGLVYDNASPELQKIRKSLVSKQKELDEKMRLLLEKYKSYLSEPIITFRNNRQCLPVLAAYKSKIKGIVLDVSQTKQTLYIEPEIAFNITSDIEYLKVLENDEITKILAVLSNDIAQSLDTLRSNLEIFVTLDINQAKALYAREIDAIMPNVNKDGNVNIIKARHPLIAKEKIVPIDISLNNDYETIVITGPNTGGKTVALKTTGLLSLMVQSGLLVPCDEKSNIAIFDSIFADIGDEQSIEQSLSTFSSHLSKIKFIIDNATKNDLVLLDEVGSGTDPQEGSSLAIAILNELRKRHLRLIATTHYSELKLYAYENEKVMSASVAFDEKTLSPLYYLVLGSSGTSNAFLIAERMNLKSEVISDAKSILENKETDLTAILKELNKEKLEVNRRKHELESKLIEQEKLISELENEKEKFTNEKDYLIKKTIQKETEKWQQLVNEAAVLIDELRKKEAISLPEAAILKKKLTNNDETNEPVTETTPLAVNDTVYIIPYQKNGTIISIKNDTYEVSFDYFRLKFKREDLRKAKSNNEKPEKTYKAKKESMDSVSRDAKLELDLRGFRYEDVKDELEKAIDKAIVSNLNVLYVIHGYGTFAVKKAVDEVIKRSPFIKSSRPGGEGEGLKGVTVIYLK